MLLDDLVIEVFEGLGEDSDLDPYVPGTTTLDPTSDGYQRLAKWINRAYKRIINWKFPSGSQVRFPSQEGELLFKTSILTGTVTSALADRVESSAFTGLILSGWIIEITGGTGVGQVRLITAYISSGVFYIHQDWTTIPDGTSTFKCYKRVYRFLDTTDPDVDYNIPLSPINQIASVRKLTDTKSLTDLALGGKNETFASSLLTHGVPSSYLLQGNAIVFDIAPDEVIWYRLEYSRIPVEIKTGYEAELPDSFNEPLILYAQWIGLRRDQQWSGAYSTKRDIEDLMASLKTSLEMAFDREDIGAFFE